MPINELAELHAIEHAAIALVTRLRQDATLGTYSAGEYRRALAQDPTIIPPGAHAGAVLDLRALLKARGHLIP